MMVGQEKGDCMRLILPFLALTVAGCSQPSEKIECPAANTGQFTGTSKDTPAQIRAAGESLGRGSENEIAQVAASLKSRHAGATGGEVVNYLVTAYCPTINRMAALDKTAKQQALRSFSARAEKVVSKTN